MKSILIVLLLTFIGCADPVKEINLKDGTKCVVVSGIYSNGISCDWKEYK